MIQKFQKKPVVIEAVKFEYSAVCLAFLAKWLGGQMGTSGKSRNPLAKGWLEVGTLEDGSGSHQVKHIATEGDYIIRGVQGEFYACKPDIFEQTYQAVTDPIVDNRDSDIGC
jgi:hypothetical protein